MQTIRICFLALALALALSAEALQPLETDAYVRFLSFKSRFHKAYPTPEVEQQKFEVFSDNLRRADELTRLSRGATVYGATRFADLTPEEFRTQFLTYKPRGVALEDALPTPVSSVAPSKVDPFDWRNKGALTPVKDQASCGSCWAMSAVEVVESAWFLSNKSNNTLVELSVQQQVDCARWKNLGCSGGDTIFTYPYMRTSGVQTEKSYPYKGVDQQCSYNKTSVAVRPTGYFYATPPCFDDCLKQDEEKLLSSLQNLGPISICVEASSWQFYESGVIEGGSCNRAYTSLNHCVLLSGFGTDVTDKYFYIVRNSWGTSYGLQGYVHLRYGNNSCGVADESTSVVF